jgi:hypothetical protein
VAIVAKPGHRTKSLQAVPAEQHPEAFKNEEICVLIATNLVARDIIFCFP